MATGTVGALILLLSLEEGRTGFYKFAGLMILSIFMWWLIHPIYVVYLIYKYSMRFFKKWK